MSENRDVRPFKLVPEQAEPGLKTLAWWAVGTGLFVTIYSLVSERKTPSDAFAIIGVFLALLVAVFVIVTVVFYRRAGRAQIDINDAVAALSRGELARAHDTFVRWSEPSRTTVSAVARHNLGWTMMRQGRLDDALEVMRNNDTVHARELKRVTFHATSSVDLSLIASLLGNLDDAESWLRITDERAAIASVASFRGMHVFARAVLDCRRGRCDEAARLLDEKWTDCEVALTGAELRPLRVVRAFAVAAGGAREAGVAEALLAPARPIFEGEYDFLGVAWPEMQVFLQTHQLARA